MDNLKQIAIYLIKTLCIDTNSEKTRLEQEITFEGKYIGTYEIVIKKVKKK